MAPTASDNASNLEAYLAKHPSIKLYTQRSTDFESVYKCFVIRPSRPFAVVRPQTAEDVQTLVRYCVQNDVAFTVRTGGHDLAGRNQVDGVLMIDMRDIEFVNINESKTTASVGGGILAGRIVEVLEGQGLITPCGTIRSVGYIGWCMYGGYGPFSTKHGLGVDQIVSAKLVDAKGDIVEANAEQLKGIRGGGCIFGIIVELTVKVYPASGMLSSMLVFDSTDMESTWSKFVQSYQQLVDDNALPTPLYVQPHAFDHPGIGKALGALVTWADSNYDEGKKWIDKISKLGGVSSIVNMTHPTTVTQFTRDNEKIVTFGSYGRCRTINLKRWTPKAAEILAKHTLRMPQGGIGLSAHSLRSPNPNQESAFGARENHHMIELIGATPVKELEDEGQKWATSLIEELRVEEPDNVLDSSYIALTGEDDTDLVKVYGFNYDLLVELKRKYDPENVFKYAVPRILV